MQENSARNESKKQISPRGTRVYIRDKSIEIKPIQVSPCAAECPLGSNVKAYISLIAAGCFAEALDVVRLTNPFPGICGRVCPHPCEDRCLRGEIDQPVSIAALKRFVADYELRRGIIPKYRSRATLSRGRVAVIGSGPAGLTCAADLAREGCAVTVFEAMPRPGGMLAYGIPAYRLPRDILEVEISAIEAIGVDIQVNVSVGEDIEIAYLLEQYDAVFIAAGATKPLSLGLPGEKDLQQGLTDWVRLLRDVELGNREKPGDRIVVVGGGNTAVDCARVALRLGARDVRLLYRRSREEMPAYRDEVSNAEEEGVRIHFLAAPVRLLLEGGKLVGVECVRMKLGSKDDTGRRRPVPIKDSTFVVLCDAVIPAIGQELDTSFLGKRHYLGVSEKGLLIVDPETLATTQKGVFAGGDAVTGPSSVVDAIAVGHRAARSILCYINGHTLSHPTDGFTPGLLEYAVDAPFPPPSLRAEGSCIKMNKRVNSFKEIAHGLTEIEAVVEAQRCLRCGPCHECRECVGVCDKKQIIMRPSYRRSAKITNKQKLLIRVPLELHRVLRAQAGGSIRYRSKKYELSILTVTIDERLCRGCGLCEEVCRYKAVQVVYRGDGIFTALVNEDMCRGCGTCTSVCPTGAVDQNDLISERTRQPADKQLHTHQENPQVKVFACGWTSTFSHPLNGEKERVVRPMCLGGVKAGEVLKAFEDGVAGVLLIGCRKDECHYGFGRDVAVENMRRVSNILALLGFDQRRLKIVEAPAGDGLDLAEFKENFLREIEGIVE